MKTEIQFSDAIFKRFTILRRKNRLAHAYLFIGPSGIGKGETARAIAKLFICEGGEEDQFCDSCSDCNKINADHHPDVKIIDNGYGETIKIEQMRELIGRNKLKPFSAPKKVFIIENIENLTPDAANAFLKTLEEPTAESLLLLTTSVFEKNLDTIISRCHLIRFQPVSSNSLAESLQKDYNIDAQSSHFLAYFAQGCPQAAVKLNAGQFVQKKNKLINTFILNRPDELSIKEMLADKVQTKEFLDICSSWIRDALLAKVGVEDQRLIHLDRIDDLSGFVKKFTFEDLRELNKSIIKMHQLLAEHLNIKLPLLIIGEQLWKN